MTFGMKFALWMDETERNIERLKLAKKYISIGKLSGAVGTYSNIDPFVEKYVCEKLGIEAARIATQVIQRDRHAITAFGDSTGSIYHSITGAFVAHYFSVSFIFLEFNKSC